MKKKSLGHPKTKPHDRQSPQDYVLALKKKYSWTKRAGVALMMFWDNQDRKRAMK